MEAFGLRRGHWRDFDYDKFIIYVPPSQLRASYEVRPRFSLVQKLLLRAELGTFGIFEFFQ